MPSVDPLRSVGGRLVSASLSRDHPSPHSTVTVERMRLLIAVARSVDVAVVDRTLACSLDPD